MNDQPQNTLTSSRLLAVILVEGFVTIATEMLTIRQLIAVVGSSVIVTSLIIGIFLLFLAFGYYRGGQCLAGYHNILKKNFTWSAFLLGIGLSYIFIQFFFLKIFQVVSASGLLALTLYLLLITAPLVYLLGQTVPITTNLCADEHRVGAISGKVLCVSTLGSFFGSIFTTLVLMNFLGVAWTIFINFTLLVLLIALLSHSIKEYFFVSVLLVAGIFIYLLNVSVEHRIFVKTNNYGNYQIMPKTSLSLTRDATGNLLSINGSASSFLMPNNRAFPYIETIKNILFNDLQLKDKDILVLGAGGFTLSAQATRGNRFLYVDIDGALAKIVRQGFVNHINGQFISEDARQFLLHTSKKFNVVVSDVYSSRYTIPFHLVTKEHFQLIQKVLTADGVAIFNIIANPMQRDNYSKRIDNTIRSVFKTCTTIPLRYRNGLTNIIYLCTAESNPDITIYTDNLNRAMTDIFNIQWGFNE